LKKLKRMGIDKYVGIGNKGNAWACNFSGLVSFVNGANNIFNQKVKI